MNERRWHGPPWRDPEWDGPPRFRHTRGVRLPVLVGLVTVIGTLIGATHQHAARPLGPLGWLLLLAGPFALLLRHRARLPVLAATIAATVAYQCLGYPYGPVVFAPIVAILGALRTGYRTPVWALVGVGYAVEVASRRFGVVHDVVTLVVLTAVLLLGEAIRVQSRYVAEFARARAEQRRRQQSE